MAASLDHYDHMILGMHSIWVQNKITSLLDHASRSEKGIAALAKAMVQKTDPASPERLMMRTTKAHQVLAEAEAWGNA